MKFSPFQITSIVLAVVVGAAFLLTAGVRQFHLTHVESTILAPVEDLLHERFLRDVTARIVGNNGRGPFPLGLCQGDCDDDSECQPGLKCHKRQSGDDAPGCFLDARRRNSRVDFCVLRDGSDGSSGASGGGDDGNSGNGGGSGSGNGGGGNGGGRPQSERFALKLYWEEGYFWQEERIHRKWCMRCRNGCRPGSRIQIINCETVRPTQWRFVNYDSTGTQVQIQVDDRPLCMQVDPGNKKIFLEACSPFEQKQRFLAQSGNFKDSPRFEIVPKVKPGWCLTQRHHPKNNEEIVIEPCVTTRLKSDTSFWNKY